jgi:hypothetical protein
MVKFLSTEEVAELAGLKPDTVSSYLSRSKGRAAEERYIPEPDILLGASRPVPGWRLETIKAWLVSRPGAGARRDLRR